ncbi:MAG: SMP-30/gluconolactonase/LRE family protein [Planctomycetota bacterium]|nr:SMP-30/gluconolactonase/LRE family protein [Planctomycetota bacterium]
MINETIRFACQLVWVAVVIVVAAMPALAQKSVWERAAELQVVSETGAGEGPAWNPKVGLVSSFGSVYLHDVENPNRGEPKIFIKDLGTNGLLWDAEGRLLCCQPSKQRVIRIEADGAETVLTDQYNNAPYNQPNDITVDEEGRIYFSDPKYGPYENLPQKDLDGNPVEGVYMIDTDGVVTIQIVHSVDRPNGVLVSKDQKYLWVAGNNNNNKGGERALFRFERMDCCGSILVDTKQLVFDWGDGRGPDGMVQDSKGNIYVAGGLNRDDAEFETNNFKGGVYVFNSSGKYIDFIAVPKDEVTNCTFGGADLKTLYITAGGTLYSIRTRYKGWLPVTARK